MFKRDASLGRNHSPEVVDLKSMMDFPKTQSNARAWRGALTLLLAAIVFGGGLFLRLHHLNLNSFWTDELLHVTSAESLLVKGKPVLPSGKLYWRAFPYTVSVAAAF